MGRTHAKGPFMVVAEIVTRPADRGQRDGGESGRQESAPFHGADS